MSRHDAPYLVKRFAPMIGRPDSPRRISLASQSYTLEAALEHARAYLAPAAGLPGGVWIERRGQSARRPKR